MAVSGSSSIRAAFVKKQSGSRASTAATSPSESRVPLQAEIWADAYDADREQRRSVLECCSGSGFDWADYRFRLPLQRS